MPKAEAGGYSCAPILSIAHTPQSVGFNPAAKSRFTLLTQNVLGISPALSAKHHHFDRPNSFGGEYGAGLSHTLDLAPDRRYAEHDDQ